MSMQGEDLSIQGSLSEASLPELLASISRSRETGVLNFIDMGRWKAVYFKEGQVVFATSNLQDDRLGEFLLKQGRITIRQFLEASKLIKPGKRLGAVLVDQDILSPDELFVAINQHVLEIVYSLFEWSRGEYEFVMKELSAEGPVSLDLSTEKVILEGIRRLHDFTRVYAGVGTVDTILRHSEAADSLVYKLELDEDESQILSLVNGRLKVEQILTMSYLSNFETLRILYGLVAAGVLERGGVEESQSRQVELEYELEEIVDFYNRNVGAVYAYLKQKLGDKAGEFADGTMARVSELFPVLFEGIELGTAGRVDFDQILANLGDKSHESKKAILVEGLNELIYGLLLEIGNRFGKQEQETVLTSISSQGPPPGVTPG
jgi:hypothetical protein